ncbi:FAD-dependent oxidoreductase [Streptomyces phaeochromogenes]|uniref:FAD-dependent oxidoreductase n=1 Tax=Streptomyces phaeochromogenes TaxID=1923 RepID=UPI0006E3499C|nr:FAD-dependent oxidoreductase [Streptomyces phaeochromogenes]
MTSVVVVGSGAAGLAAALSARESGAEVTVVEATPTIGGTTALSSGAAWLPDNHLPLAAEDSPQRARTYLSALGRSDENGHEYGHGFGHGHGFGAADTAMSDRFVDEAPRVAEWLEMKTPLRWATLPVPDCHGTLPGGYGAGRSLEPRPFRAPPRVAALVRAALPWRSRATLTELLTGKAAPDLIEQRRQAGTHTAGQALVAALLTAAVDAGVTIRTHARATRFLGTGVAVDGTLLAGRVVLATGGFERDEVLVRRFLGGPIAGLTGAPGARGDGLRMAVAAGATLHNTGQAWWCPTIRIPGDAIDDEPVHRILLAERARPGAVLVDCDGHRFTNEARNYHEVGRSLHPTEPSWLIVDAAHRRRYPIGPVRPADPDPDWLQRACTLPELARLIDVPGDALAKTISRFNWAAAAGEDPDFDRGANPYDGVMGDPGAVHPTLGPLYAPPFYAVPVRPGLGGTSGGPRTDPDGRVLRDDGAAVPGLYAAGNVAAGPFGSAYPGTGATIGQALVFGAQAGRAAAGD